MRQKRKGHAYGQDLQKAVRLVLKRMHVGRKTVQGLGRKACFVTVLMFSVLVFYKTGNWFTVSFGASMLVLFVIPWKY